MFQVHMAEHFLTGGCCVARLDKRFELVAVQVSGKREGINACSG
jgi:hypothetical protein